MAAAISYRFFNSLASQKAVCTAHRYILADPTNYAGDGNKRTALFAVDMFLKINGYRLQKKPMDNDGRELNQGLADAHVLVASSQWTSEDLGHYYASVAKPLEEKGREITE
ncbi:hypothetical protein ED733_003326 [Metarhizium rileyi]|uniref:Fido domain-containing protein n=1 Tax=Metarhizium rileyi (strain RCEF 4871) TaxID=1649241 RepID=A0A5C6G588_METRR|nr:hypothetical protein ED733_003326 [Metarhizium rileyi]